MNKEEEIAYFREKLRPYITEVMNQVNKEETQRLEAANRRGLYDVIRQRDANNQTGRAIK